MGSVLGAAGSVADSRQAEILYSEGASCWSSSSLPALGVSWPRLQFQQGAALGRSQYSSVGLGITCSALGAVEGPGALTGYWEAYLTLH